MVQKIEASAKATERCEERVGVLLLLDYQQEAAEVDRAFSQLFI